MLYRSGIPGSIQRLAQAFHHERNVRLKASVPLQHPACPDNIRVCRGSRAKARLLISGRPSGPLQFPGGDFLDSPLGKELKLGLVASGESARLRVKQA